MMFWNWKNIFADKIFALSFGISVAIHLIVLVDVCPINFLNKPLPRIVYGKIYPARKETRFQYVVSKKAKIVEKDISIDNAFSKPSPSLPDPNKVIRKGDSNATKSVLPATRQMGKVEILSPKATEDALFKKVIVTQTVPKSPEVRQKYIDYYEKIRQKIRGSAYRLFTSGTRGGDVYISFELDNEGSLIEAHVVVEKSSGGSRLYDIAMKSIREAAPFGKFPPQLVHKKLRFNVIISFRR